MENFTHNGFQVTIEQDQSPESPRDWDNMGKMVCFHRRYSLGDKHSMSLVEAKKLESSKDVISLPLYLYDHSGITMKTSPFSCPWDSGKVGFIYVSRADVLKEYSRKKLSKKLLAKVIEQLQNEVLTYDQYLTGDVHCYIVEDNEGNIVDSLGGVYGLDYCREEAKSAASPALMEKISCVIS